MEIKVRAVESGEQKSAQEVEQELLQKHEQQSQEPEASNDVTEESEAPELSEEQVLSFIKNRYNKEVDTLDQLVEERSANQEIPEDIASYMKYRQETGRGYDDYLKLNRNYDELDEEQLIKDYLLSTEEGIDPDDVDFMLEDYRFDEEFDDDADVKKKRIARKKTVAKAKEYFNSQKEQYAKPLESSPAGMPQEEKEAFEAYKQYLKEADTIQQENQRKSEWFQQKTNEVFNKEFKGFEFQVGDKKVVYSPGDAEEIKKANSTPMNLIGKFLDDDGLLTDPQGYHQALSVAMNPSKFAQFFYEQGKADAVDDVSRKSKNIKMDTRRAPETTRKDGLSIRTVSQPSNGNRLVIRSPKNR